MLEPGDQLVVNDTKVIAAQLDSRPSRSGAARILAAAIASCTARLTPTPPIGDIACAASPMHNRPGFHHWVSRSTATVKSLMSSQSVNWATRSAK